MRISDWSSDVCSSDLLVIGSGGLSHDPPVPNVEQAAAKQREFLVHGRSMPHQLAREREANVLVKVREFFQGGSELLPLNPEWDRCDRKSVVSGKRVSVRVDLGGCRIH